MIILKKLMFVFCLLIYFHSYAQLKPAKIFSDNIVLQRGVKILVWGKAIAGEVIQVRLDSVIVVGRANEKGVWKINLLPQLAGGTRLLTIRGEIDSIVFENVLIGDVWFASGQFNMEHPLKGWDWIPHSEVNKYEEELKDANYPQIRLFNVQKSPSPVEQDDLLKGIWEMSNPETVANFSSIAWVFAKELHQELNIPISIIHSSWDGTSIQSWMIRKSLIIFKNSISIPALAENFQFQE